MVYMDPSDGEKARRVSLYMGIAIRISDYSFLWVIRAVIPGRHILVDNSFQTRLDEATITRDIQDAFAFADAHTPPTVPILCGQP